MESNEKILPTPADIHTIFCKYAVGIDYLSNTRERQVVDYRAFFVKMCIDYTSESLSSIGRFIKKDHSTIVHYKNNFDVFAMNNKKAYSRYIMAENELMYVYPAVAHLVKNRRKGDKEPEMDFVEVHKMYSRRLHAIKTKMNFYKDMTKKLKRDLKKVKNEV